MLCELRVENLALIESLELQFKENAGLVVMTGETGAGKSIMLRAIKLLTGARASADWVRSGAKSCVVEALFEIKADNPQLAALLEEGGFEDGRTIIIKRVLTQDGRSKLYINGSMAPAKKVSELTVFLLNVASQHDHQQLLQPALHLDFLDTLGELWPARESFSQLFNQWRHDKEQLRALKEKEQDKEQKRDFLQYQLDEIEQAAITIGEDEELAAEKKRLKNGDTLVKVSQQSYSILSSSVVDELGDIRRNLAELAQLDPDIEELADELSEYSYMAEEYAQRLREYRDSLEVNPLRLDQVTERIDQLQHLKRKYGETLENVLEFARQAHDELEQIDSLEHHIAESEKQLALMERQLIEQADDLSNRRKKTAQLLEKGMSEEMKSLAFNQAGLEVRWQDDNRRLEAIRNTGWDRVEFFFSANPGEPARALAKVASGGELSRLLLAMKCILAKKDLVETVLFDEVDAGIGGEAAEAVARKIKQLAEHHQVFCITHLPQIAARGTEHFLVAKTVTGERTQSSINKLVEEDRISEIVRMLAGESATVQTRAWAEELLEKGKV